MAKLISKLNRHVEIIAAHRRPEILHFLMLCFATTTMSMQPGARTITMLLAFFTLFAAVQIVSGDRYLQALPTTRAADGIVTSIFVYLSAGDLALLVANYTSKLSPIGQANLADLIRCGGIAFFIGSCAYTVTALVSTKLNWTRP